MGVELHCSLQTFSSQSEGRPKKKEKLGIGRNAFSGQKSCL